MMRVALEQGIRFACSQFANLIVAATRQTDAFESVSRETSGAPGTLVISGEITEYDPGNSMARLWLPGAGSSDFDATVRFTDAQTGEVLGTVTANKHSWALGGAIAAGQTVDTLMEDVAGKIAERLAEASNQPD